MSNSLIDSLLPFIPFDKISASDFLPALTHYRKIADDRLQKIRENQDQPNFDNTILAIETAAEELSEVTSAYYVLFSAEATPEIQKIAGEVASFLADFSSDLFLDPILFDRVKQVFDNQENPAYLVDNLEKKRLLELTYRNYKRNGALLSEEKKEELRSLDNELSKLAPIFSEYVLKATNAFSLHITDEAQVKGLPESLLAQASERASQLSKKSGWVFTLQYPDYMPFMTYCSDRSLREKMYRAFRSRGLAEDTDNRPIIKELLSLKYRRANLLGYKTHADYVLEERMAGDRQTVIDFLDDLLSPVLPAAKKELTELTEFAASKGCADLQPWDLRFYSEQLKKEKYDFDQESLRVYFPLEKVISGLFDVAQRLYGIRLEERNNIPVYHSEVRVFEVVDQSGSVGYFYMDLFPRETKKSGAWMTAIREQGLFQGKVGRPHVGIVCNFTKPTKSHPSLLTLDEVRTLFHEFGHSLHGLLSSVTYRSLAGTNVYWDFVELPSQIMENWPKERQVLDLFARHFETNQPIPTDLLDRLKKAETFQAGIAFLTQLNYANLDMAYYTKDPADIIDIEQFEEEATKPTTLLKDPVGTCISTGFSHIFAGGYSAGYYSYKWAEVLEADAFDLFRDKGVFDQETAASFRQNILERGNTEHPMQLFKRFRGRAPDAKALLRRDGLLA
ncbi:MAG: M3 family metallopeptidase [Leptonema sp. (in: Bacteria)]|nr:M3 family metallopeptidase [Leptonema sp. (in: bacteria)]